MVSPLMRARRGDLAAFLVLLGLVLGCFARLVAHPTALLVDGDRPSVDGAQREDVRPLGNDLTFIVLPHYLHVAEEFARHGRLPRWDASGFAGRPMVGNPQGGLFYPPVWLALWSRSPAAPGWLTLAHLLWAGCGTYVLLRSLGAGRVASTVAAGCFEACPYVLAQTFEGHYPHIWSVAWYPWAFYAYRQLRLGRQWGGLLLPPILGLSFLAGHPQEAYYLVFTLSVWAGYDALRQVRSGQPRSAALSAVAWTAVLGATLGIVAIELIPDLAAQAWTLRNSRMSLGRVSHYQLHPLHLFQLLGPGALGGPADYFGPDNLWETLFSVGLVPLVLAAIAAACHPDRKVVRGWLLLVVAAAIFAAGRRLGLFTLLFEIVPGMNRFRVPARSLFLASLGASVLAGLGVEAMARGALAGDAGIRLVRRLGRGALVVVLGLLVVSWWARPDEVAPPVRSTQALTYLGARKAARGPERRAYRVPIAASRLVTSGTFWLALGGTAAAFGLGCLAPRRRRMLAAGLGMLALVEVGLHGFTLLKVAPAGRFLGPDPISTALANATPPCDGPFRIRARDVLYSDLRAGSHGFEKTNINDSFQLQHAADLYKTLYPLLYVPEPVDPGEFMGAPVAQFRREVRQGVLDRMGVAFLVTDHVEPEPSWPLVASGTWEGSAFAIHRNPSAMPRAYVVPGAESDPAGAMIFLSRSREIDPRRAVLMAADPLGPEGPRQPYTPASWDSNDPDRLVLRVMTRAPGLLIVADTWMPGWTAQVDGRPAPILRGNHAQRVVPLPEPGRHEVVMRYEPPGFALGIAVTSASLLALMVTACILLRPTSRSRNVAPAPHFGRRRGAMRGPLGASPSDEPLSA